MLVFRSAGLQAATYIHFFMTGITILVRLLSSPHRYESSYL